MTLAAGTRLGPYELLMPIGAGGMGEVWKARDTRLDRVVAIKRLKGNHIARFEQEARAIAALNHPHICQIYDVGPDYLVMEFIDGVPPRGPLPVEEAVRLAIQIASGLEEAHSRGILHRDLKPANVLVTPKGAAKLLDFGLAKLIADSDATLTIGISGTPRYMSPEQAEGKTLDARSDVFSFGAVLYELLAGRPAFDNLVAVLRDDPQALQVPARLQSIVTHCLRKNAAERFGSMSEARAALEQLAARPAQQQPSIAVLPFVNMSGDKEQEYFSDGLTEEIINALVKMPGLRVIARTSAFAFKGQNTDIRKIAETLGVANVLEGSVRRSGSRIRVTAQLITAADGSHLWSERYDRELADVFVVQDEVSAAISEALHLKLSPQPAAKPRYIPKLTAHEALLKARYYHWKMTPDSMARAKEFFEQAIALDPQYALARAAFADYLFGLSIAGMTPAHETMPVIRAMAQEALELDPSLPEAHASLGMVAAVYDYNWKEAARRFALAMASEAVSPWVHTVCGGFYFLAAGRRKEGVEQTERAVQADPLDLFSRAAMAFCLTAAGRYAEAEAHLRQVLDLDSNFFMAQHYLAALYAAQGRFVEALPFARKAYFLRPRHSNATGAYAALLIVTGEQDQGKALVQELGSGQAYGAPMGLAIHHTYRGEIDLAADWIEKAIEQRIPEVGLWVQGANTEPLRASPRWRKLAALMNLPEARP